ncbi:MAG: lecithin retinol acyltransferase family protein [Cocleimonas sp.]
MSDSYRGQHLIIQKAGGTYTHHALGLGNGRVIHYSGLANDLTTEGVIEEVNIDEFSKGKEIKVKPHEKRRFTVEEAILRATLRLGEAQYHILHNNCEHLVEWCISGEHRSWQSRRGKLLYSAGMGTRALVGVKNPVAFIAGAAAGYVYINKQAKKKMPDFDALEKAFTQKQSIILLPHEK